MNHAPEPSTVDLDACAREAIHIPGAIQPHGVLLAVREPDLVCEQISANAGEVLGSSAKEWLGRPLGAFFGPDALSRIEAALAAGDPRESSPLAATIGERNFSVVLHRHDGELIVELEPLDLAGESIDSSARLHRRLQTALGAMRAASDLAELFPIIAQTIAALTGFERVMVYRFDEDWHGEVVGEALSSPDVDSYFGLHFPASDIPAQARALYEKNRLRLIPTVDYAAAALEPSLNPQTGRPLDLSFAALRSVSPIHLEYLRNMSVGASMSVSLLVDGRLWGLVACHHRQAHFVAAAVRDACELFGQAASTEIAAKHERRLLAEQTRAQGIQTRFFDIISGATDVFAALVEYTPQLLELMSAGGCAVWIDGRYTLLGQTPGEEDVAKLVRWLEAQDVNPVLATDFLASLLPEAAAWSETASGLLAIRLSRVEPHFVLWFRPEVLTTVHWAGNPEKPVEVGARLHPRKSFASWKETVRGRSLPWTAPELIGARELHQALNALVLRRAEGLMRLNRELERRNTDLNSFAYIAAHDLREPVRGIYNFSQFIRKSDGERMDAESLRRLDTITSLSLRVDHLLAALLRYSDLGRIELKLAEVPLDQLLDESLEGLSSFLQEKHVEVHRSPLPRLRCDPVLVREVFANLIVNAVKYTPGPEKWVEVGSREGRPEAGERGPVIFVRDKGIGIRPRHHEDVFQMFRRLHARDKFGGGIGVGLAIVKSVIERHGGRVWIESVFGQGATFCFTLS